MTSDVTLPSMLKRAGDVAALFRLGLYSMVAYLARLWSSKVAELARLQRYTWVADRYICTIAHRRTIATGVVNVLLSAFRWSLTH